jgi:small subunit ribosomal protein S17
MSANVETESPKTTGRRRTRKVGTVVSAKMEKTIVVEVTRFVKNARYGRIQKRTVRFLADDRVLGCKPGDVVEIEETRPLSARKRWRVKSVVTRGRGLTPEIAGGASAS